MTRDVALMLLDEELKKGGYTRDDFTSEEIERTIQMMIDADKSRWWYIKWLPTTLIMKARIYFQKLCTWLLILATRR